MQKLQRLDGRHKLAVLGALICWVLSVYFSYLGFKVDNEQMLWVGWVLAIVVTIVELVFNSPTKDLSLTLVIAGIMCYGYGIWTNVTGFWSLQHPGIPFELLSMKSIMPYFIGLILEVLPEPLIMWGLMASTGGDFIGNISGLWNGTMTHSQGGSQGNQNNIQTGGSARYVSKQHQGKFNIPTSIPRAAPFRSSTPVVEEEEDD